MEGMAEFPDQYFELAVVDPPYGGRYASKCKDRKGIWDYAPQPEYFEELFRVSKNQIIWGGNYFNLPPTRGFIVWHKPNIAESFSMAMCEYAWTSFDRNAKLIRLSSQYIRHEIRFHPTQKPVALYEWILRNYAQKGDKVLDTHAGSASSLIACHNMNFAYIGFEISEEYYQKAHERLENVKAQQKIW